MALTPLSNGGNKALAKLTIIPFLNRLPYIIPGGPPFIAMYNPTTFSTRNAIKTVQKYTSDGAPAVLSFKQVENRTLKVDLLLDATGASPAGGIVGATLSKTAKTLGGVDVLIAAFFLATRTPKAESHQPNILRVIWGAGLFLECVLLDATVTYTLFGSDGRPLRATISATFEEAMTPTSLSKIKNFFSSPDVTKTYTVKAGDTIYNLAQREYGDDSFYLQIAEANDLKNYRKLIPGQVLIFPPINQEEVVEE
jgi:nucleoid-associated protein YgaU